MRFVFAIVCYVLLGACTSAKTIHRQVMDSFVGKTKQDLIDRFGVPTQKREAEGYEQWEYYYGSTSSALTMPAYGNNMAISGINTYRKYLIFEIDKDGYVYKWRSNGVYLKP